MQKMRTYEGALTVGSTSTRQVAWGDTSATATVYESKVDFLNSTIASFLTECGISASYTQKSGESYKWLYIYNVPFLAFYYSSSVEFNFGFPMLSLALNISSTTDTSWNIFETYSSGNYKFSLVFSGSATYGFILRICPYSNTSTPSGFYYIGFFKCKNTINNNRQSLAFVMPYYNSASQYLYVNAIDMSSNATSATPVTTYYSGASMGLPTCVIRQKPITKQQANGKFPLVPVFFGTYKMDGLYCYPTNFGLPDAVMLSTPNLTEFSIGSKTFINLNTQSRAESTAYMGDRYSGILDTTS